MYLCAPEPPGFYFYVKLLAVVLFLTDGFVSLEEDSINVHVLECQVFTVEGNCNVVMAT